MYSKGDKVRVYLSDNSMFRDGTVVAVADQGLYEHPVVVEHQGFSGAGLYSSETVTQFFDHEGKNPNEHVFISTAPRFMQMNITNSEYDCPGWEEASDAEYERNHGEERRSIVGFLSGEYDETNDAVINVVYTNLENANLR